MDAEVRRFNDVEHFMEGEEHCRSYFKTAKLSFGTSTLMPGKNGTVDPGHKEGEEVFYVCRGRILLYLPSTKKYRELGEGDAIIIPPGEPHQLYNPYPDIAVVCWCLSPPDRL
ncbi:cupin domain-containing protein [[Eubacterium] cellulosolvens]